MPTLSAQKGCLRSSWRDPKSQCQQQPTRSCPLYFLPPCLCESCLCWRASRKEHNDLITSLYEYVTQCLKVPTPSPLVVAYSSHFGRADLQEGVNLCLYPMQAGQGGHYRGWGSRWGSGKEQVPDREGL